MFLPKTSALWFLAPLLLSALLVPAACADPLDLAEADARVERLKKGLASSRTSSRELLDALDDVESSYLSLRAAVTPETKAAWTKWRDQAEKLYLKAFALVKLDRSKERNIREDVNVKAAGIIGRTGHSALWKSVRRTLEKRVFKARHEVSQPLLQSGFDAIAALGDPAALTWMADEFIHTNSSPEKVVNRLVAAQRAFVKFPLERVPGKARHAIVKKLVQLYPATETVAQQNSNQSSVQSTRRFWDRIRTGVILAAQHFAGTPRNADGEALVTMHEFSEWFRDHKDVRRAPWADPAAPRG